MHGAIYGLQFAVTRLKMPRRNQIAPAAGKKSTGAWRLKEFNSPQTRHNAERSRTENGGILRIPAGAAFVARIAVFDSVLEIFSL
jgi:hypothetical protein